MYQERLKDRERRRQAARDFNLVRHFFRDGGGGGSAAYAAASRFPGGQIKPAKRSKTELADRLKAAARFQPSAEEHNRFVSSMLRERELKARIKELSRYRKNGVHGAREAEQFDAERVRRNKEKAERKRAQETGGGGGLEAPPPSPRRESQTTAGGGPDLDSLTSVVGLPGEIYLQNRVPEPGYLAGAGAVTLARLRLHLLYFLNNSCKIFGT